MSEPLKRQENPMSKQELTPAAEITPMTMLNMAVQQNADLDKLEKLMTLQERWEKNEARKDFVAALSAFKGNPPTVSKNKKAGFDSKRTNTRTEYEYATLPQVVRAIAPALSEHGLSHNWSVAQNENRISVTCTLTHESGHGESVTLTAPADDSGSKNSIQSIGSTVTYLERYSLLAITGLATDDMDDDGAGATTFITVEQASELQTMMLNVQADEAKFLRFLGIEKLTELPANKFKFAVDALEKKRNAT